MKITSILKFLPCNNAYAHCDIPCGIYDVHQVQMAAHTVIRMTQLINDINRENEIKAEHDIARMTHIKEGHGQIIETELGTLQNDYFKAEHFEKFPELKDLLIKGVLLSVKARQNIDFDQAKDLLEVTMKIAEIFYKSKGLEFSRVKSPYPTGFDIVIQR
jgi:nickel superoxide dismutase